MAIIGSIRKRSGLLITMIGVALLLFLLGDFFSGGSQMFRNQSTSIGEIAGKEISQRDFEVRVQEAIDKQFGVDGANDRAKSQVRNRVWQEIINELIVKKEYEKLGISVSPDELLDQVKNTQPGSILQQYFTDPNTGQIIEQFRNTNTGGLDAQKVLAAVQNILNSDNAEQWLPIEAAIKEDVARSKYANLLGKGIYTTSLEAQDAFNQKNTSVTFSFVVKEFNSVPADDVELTEADYQKYYDEHKHEDLYQMDMETRDLIVVKYDVIPTEEDIKEIYAEMDQISAAFAADSNDTAFVLENADGQLPNLVRYYKEEEIPSMIKDSVIVGENRSIFGPYENGKVLFATKLLSTKMSPDSVEASHILIRVDDGDTNKIAAARAKLDSLKAVAKKSGNFAELAEEFSDDLGSGAKGGELDWFARGRMVPPFEKAAFDGAVGDMPIVESQFGVHLIYITNQTEPKKNYLLASVDMPIVPSKYTADMVYKEASKFAVENNTAQKFEESGRETFAVEGLSFQDEMVGPLALRAKEIVRWAHGEDVEVGQVSSPFEVDDKIVVAIVTKIRPEGQVPFEIAKGIMQPMLLLQKRAEMITNDLGDFSTLDNAASKMGVEVSKIDNARLGDQSIGGGIGREPAVLGSLSALEIGQVSKAIKGNRGVYVVRLDSRTDAPSEGDYSQEQTMSNNRNYARASNSAQPALQKVVGVDDDRAKFY